MIMVLQLASIVRSILALATLVHRVGNAGSVMEGFPYLHQVYSYKIIRDWSFLNIWVPNLKMIIPSSEYMIIMGLWV